MKSIELIVFNRNQNLQYESECKLSINKLSKMLVVEPKNEEYKIMSAKFQWNFVVDKNILFVFSENEINDFALIFDSEIRCRKVFHHIGKENVPINISKHMIYNKFFVPFCKKIAKNDDTDYLQLKKMIARWIDNHEDGSKQEYIKLLKENNVYDLVYFNAEKVCNNKNGEKEDGIKKITKKQNGNKNLSRSSVTKIVGEDFFKIVNVMSKFRFHRRLIIFTTLKKENCIEYLWNPKTDLYYCVGCKASNRKKVIAFPDRNEKGVDCIRIEEKHVCTPIQYIPEKYIESTFFKKTDYEILDKCNSKTGKKYLILFDRSSKDKKCCWEFRLEKEGFNKFRCRKCNASAVLWNQGSEEKEYFELRTVKHGCKSISFDRQKYYEFNNYILPPDFEVQTGIKTGKKMLIIFDKNDRSLCYIYRINNKNRFYCRGCWYRKRIQVTAKLMKNFEGEEYVLLSKLKHICELQSYKKLPTKKEEIVLHPPDFELKEINGIKKLFIFHSNDDRNLCYEFSPIINNKSNGFHCIGCLNCRKRQYRNTNGKNQVKVVRAQLCKNNEDDEFFIRLNDSTQHTCKPKKYEPEKYNEIIKEIPKCYDYFFFRRKSQTKSINVAIYHPENKNLCFKFNYNKNRFHFRCQECALKEIFGVIKIEKDADGKEYFKHDLKKHVCEPIKVSSIRGPEFRVLKRNEINLEEKKKKPKAEKRSKIIKYPKFQLSPNEKGVPDAALFISHSGDDDQSLGFKYYYSNYYKKYLCCKLTSDKCYATAKLEKDKNNEKFIILGQNEHRCAPVKIFENTIIPSSNFIVFSDASKKRGFASIVVFTNQEHDQCYEFGPFGKMFRCLGCKSLNAHVSVKLCKNENGEEEEEYLQMLKNEHICVPRKYIKEKYQPKIIPYEFCQLYPNKKGEQNKRLIIFTTEKKDFCYEFYWTIKESFCCGGCRTTKYNMLVKLLEDKNGQKYIECGQNEHVCKPKKYDPKKYV